MESKSSQLKSLRSFYQIRADAALQLLRENKTALLALEGELALAKQKVVDLNIKLQNLNATRLDQKQITVEHLLAESSARSTLERDACDLHTTLQTIERDVLLKSESVFLKRTDWKKHCDKLDAIAKLESDHQLHECHRKEARRAREMDEHAMRNHVINAEREKKHFASELCTSNMKKSDPYAQ